MKAKLLRAADRIAVPWKDGGGVTREIAAFPPGADMGGFEWRVSTATVADAGPFSRFAGVDRTLAVLSGTLALRIADEAARLLTVADPPLFFAGDAACFGEPIGAPVDDLNVMVRRSCWTAEVRRAADKRVSIDAGSFGLVVVVAAATVMLEGSRHDLAPLDALLIEPAEEAYAMAISGGNAFVIMLRRVSTPLASAVREE